jgi:hypothetical protein
MNKTPPAPTLESTRSEDPDRAAILQRRAALVAAAVASIGIACTPTDKATAAPNVPSPATNVSVDPVPQVCLSPMPYVASEESSDAGAHPPFGGGGADTPDATPITVRPQVCLSVRRRDPPK